MKTCSKCHNTKVLKLFSKDKNQKDGYQTRCKECCSTLNKKWSSMNKEKKTKYLQKYYQENKDKFKVINATRYKSNPKKHIEYSQKWRKQNPDQFRGTLLKSRFWPNLSWQESLNQYNALLKNQNYSCGICHKHKSTFNKELAVDHCHTTGKVRGLLCDSCNKGLGLLGDSLQAVKSALNYLGGTNE